VIDYDISLSGVRMTKKEIIALFAFVLLFYGSLRAITGTEYVKIPQGDAEYYSMMALFFEYPEEVPGQVPLFYSQRLFPPFMGYLLSSQFVQRLENGRFYTDTEIYSYWETNFRVLRYAWEVSNLIAYFITVLFIFLLLSHFKIKTRVIWVLIAIYSMWFVTVRLYVNWVQMADPWSFAFLSAASYFLAVSGSIGFLVTIVLGLLCKESVLFLLPSYLWKTASEGGLKGRGLIKTIPVVIIPVLVFFLVRKFPYFPSILTSPDTALSDAAPIEANGMPGMIADYLYLIKYHYFSRLGEDPFMFMADMVLIPFGTFSALLCFLIWHYRRTYQCLKKVSYWIPFAIFTLLTGVNVGRHLIYLFPVVLLAAALVLNQGFDRKHLAYLSVFLLAVTFAQNQLYVAATTLSDISLFSTRHQLEAAVDLNKSLAVAYRHATLLATAVSFAGFWAIGRAVKYARAGS